MYALYGSSLLGRVLREAGIGMVWAARYFRTVFRWYPVSREIWLMFSPW